MLKQKDRAGALEQSSSIHSTSAHRPKHSWPFSARGAAVVEDTNPYAASSDESDDEPEPTHPSLFPLQGNSGGGQSSDGHASGSVEDERLFSAIKYLRNPQSAKGSSSSI
eukprot:1151343-Pelagomonas_calceolata.AAC.3